MSPEADDKVVDATGAVVDAVGVVVEIAIVGVDADGIYGCELPPPPPLELLLLLPEQILLDGVIVTVRSAVPTYAISESEAVQVLLEISVVVSVLSTFRFGADTWIEDPDSSVKLKDDAFTLMDSMTAGEPEISTSTPPTLSATFVLRDTVL